MTSSESPLFPLVSGTLPGVIDNSQRERLLQTPSTVLCFATFDPLTARVSNDKGNDGLQGSAHPYSRDGKRIVVETDTNTGICTWRFVPRAKMDLGVNDEGTWPRLVQLCGRVVRMTQDQWDIHKLDPEYECVVRASPEITYINRHLPAADIPENLPSHAAHDPVQETPPNKYTSMEGTTPTPRTRATMPSSGETSTRTSSNFQSPNQMAVDTDTNNHYFHFEASQRTPKTPRGKRPRGTPTLRGKHKKSQASSLVESFSSSSGSETESGPTKKTRIHDPLAARRQLSMRRFGRERKRKAELDARLKTRRDALQNAFWDELGVPPDLRDPTFFSENNNTEPEPELDNDEENVFEATSETTTEEDNEDDEAIRQSRIEESRRKLAELERDRPLWEEAARRRKEEELREEEERKRNRIRREEERRKREEEERRRAAYRRYREQWELEQESHEREMNKREKGSQMFVAPARGIGAHRWTIGHALKRCLETASRFDSAKYTTSNPLDFKAIPWPISKASFTINDIEWEAVEKFFKMADLHLPANEFRDLVEKSHKRFHPDRWRSRRILLSVQDDLERDLLEVAGSTVAQALTPLWKKVTGRE